MEFYPPRGKKLSSQIRIFAWWFAKTWNPVLAVTKSGIKFNREYDQKYYATKLLRNDRVKRAVMEAFRKQVKISGHDEPEFAMTRVLNMFKQLEKVVGNISSNLETKQKVTEEDVKPLVDLMNLNKEMIEMTSNWLGYSDNGNGNEETTRLSLENRRTFGGFLTESSEEIPKVEIAAVVPPEESPDETEKSVDSGDLSFESVLKTDLLETKE